VTRVCWGQGRVVVILGVRVSSRVLGFLRGVGFGSGIGASGGGFLLEKAGVMR